MLTSKFVTSQPTWEATNFNAHIAQYHRKKSNQKMKYGQFIEYSMGNIFLGKSYTKRGGETIPKIKIKHISGPMSKVL